MRAAERRRGVWAADTLCIGRRLEPKTQMVGLNRAERGVYRRIRDWAGEDYRRWRGTWRNSECLDAKSPPKMLDGIAVDVGSDILSYQDTPNGT